MPRNSPSGPMRGSESSSVYAASSAARRCRATPMARCSSASCGRSFKIWFTEEFDLPASYTEAHCMSHDGLRLYTRIYQGPAASAASVASVLCLHGLTRNSRDFEDLAPHLQQRYRVIVPDVRGRGFSARDPNPQNYQPAIYLQDILALLDYVDAQRVAVIGTSMGGMLAMMMAVGSRDRVTGVVLNDMGPEVDPEGLE